MWQDEEPMESLFGLCSASGWYECFSGINWGFIYLFIYLFYVIKDQSHTCYTQWVTDS